MTLASLFPTSRQGTDDVANTPDPWPFWIIVGALFAALLKTFIALRTFGTNDILTFYLFGKSLTEHGLADTYKTMLLFNHPPLTAYFLRAIYYLQGLPFCREHDISFAFLLRFPGIVADFLVVLVLVRLRREAPELRLPGWALLLFALSPLSVMVSGYHGNTDPIMVLFFVLSVYSCGKNRPALSGLLLALSVQVKIIPLLFLPIFLCFWLARKHSLRFAISFATLSLVLWSEPLLRFPAAFIRNVLSYGSYWGIWGISYLLRLTGQPAFQRVSFYDLTTAQSLVMSACKLLIIFSVLLLAWRCRHTSLRGLWDSLAYGWLVFFVFAPGVCTQYLIWLAPFLLILSPVSYSLILLASSLFAFVFYNVISHGLPWYRGISTNQLNHLWTPWSLLPWLLLLGVLAVHCQRIWRRQSSLHSSPVTAEKRWRRGQMLPDATLG